MCVSCTYGRKTERGIKIPGKKTDDDGDDDDDSDGIAGVTEWIKVVPLSIDILLYMYIHNIYIHIYTDERKGTVVFKWDNTEMDLEWARAECRELAFWEIAREREGRQKCPATRGICIHKDYVCARLGLRVVALGPAKQQTK